MGGVEGDEAELAGLHALHDGFGTGVVLILHFAMTPEDQHVGLVERGVAEALVGIGEASGLDLEIFILRDFSRERLAEELIAVALGLLGLLFVPDQDADGLRVGRQGKEGKEGEEKAHGVGGRKMEDVRGRISKCKGAKVQR